MLPYDEALIEARQHLYSTTPPLGYVWLLRHGQRVKDGWFFWQHMEPLRFIKDPDARFGGGFVGFTVTDDRRIRVHGLLSVPAGVSRDSDNKPSHPPNDSPPAGSTSQPPVE